MEPIAPKVLTSLLVKVGFEIFKGISSIRPHRINGSYCTCWQCDPTDPTKYEVGSMRIYKVGQKVKGFITCSDAVWPIDAKYVKRNSFAGEYTEEHGDKASFSLEAASGGRVIDRYIGTWEGTVDSKRGAVPSGKLKMFAARNARCKDYCNIQYFTEKRYAEDESGECLFQPDESKDAGNNK